MVVHCTGTLRNQGTTFYFFLVLENSDNRLFSCCFYIYLSKQCFAKTMVVDKLYY